MSRVITNSIVANTGNCIGQLAALIDAAPDDVWLMPAGAWPLWQHVIHAIWASDFFTPGPATPSPGNLPLDVIQLKMVGIDGPTKNEAKDYLAAVRAKVDAFTASLDDASLAKANEATAKIGLNWDLATTLCALGSHAAYHVGHGDALLRAEGLPGVF